MTAAVPGGPRSKHAWRSGVRFDSPGFGLLGRDDAVHGETRPEPCGTCGGVVRLVVVGETTMQGAK